ncbi:hypothetical protein IFM89_039730 [Coptis chinensis]|uniref:PUB domain-containing protein n=1 Tax=Coptis chinensis TaxID=261450 RepID=A0A835GU23_9MAGN|nr:hypothetical protein IFM89_039730 [Coptis chinensis]
MEDVKDKMKGFMKKVNNPFSSSSSGKFKGQGRTLGSSSSSSSTTTPIVNNKPSRVPTSTPPPPFQETPQIENTSGGNELLAGCVTTFVSGQEGSSADVVLKLLRNILKEPENAKFRRIRLSNPKIREAIVDVAGGVELLECVGFKLEEENGEMWALIPNVPMEEEMSLIREAVSLLEPKPVQNFSLPTPGQFSLRSTSGLEPKPELEPEQSLGNATVVNEPQLPQTIDRQVQVFFSAPGSVMPKTDVPDSFYNLSAAEVKREADMRKKKIAESQLLIPKSYKESKAKDARKRYKSAVIRIQFPDQVVLQGVFLPWESTTALYEVSTFFTLVLLFSIFC